MMTDIAIIGGGIAGLSSAYKLAKHGWKVTMIDRGVAAGASTHASAGMLAPISEAELETPELARLASDSLARYPAYVAELEADSGITLDYRREGTLWVAFDDDDEAELEHLCSMQRELGFSSEWLSGEAVRALEPRLSPRIRSGISIPSDHSIDPRRLSLALRTALQKQGGCIVAGQVHTCHLRTHSTVELLGQASSGKELAITSRRVLLAAGAWCGGIDWHPGKRIDVRPVKGEAIRLRGKEQLLRHVVRSPRIYLVPRSNGELTIGATLQEQQFDDLPQAGSVMDLLQEAWRCVPAIEHLSINELCVGFRPAVCDHLPVVGPLSDTHFISTGHFRHGILLAPAISTYLSQQIVHQELADNVASFQPRGM